MLELISVIVTTLSIIQNLTKNKPDKSRLNDIKEIVKNTQKVYLYLNEAKVAHDEFEKFDAFIIAPILRELSNDVKLNQIQISEISQELIKASDRFIKDTHVKVIEIHDENKVISEAKKVPINIRQNIETIINRIYPRFTKNVNAYYENLNQYIALVNMKNFGDEYKSCISLIGHSVYEIKASADDLIFNLVPILLFFQYSLEMKLEEI